MIFSESGTLINPYFADKLTAMTEQEKLEIMDGCRELLARADHKDRRTVIWSLLSAEVAGRDEAVTWLLFQVGKLIDGEEKRLMAPFQ